MRLYPRMTITVSLAHAAKSFIALNPRETISFPQIADESIVTSPIFFFKDLVKVLLAQQPKPR